MFIDTSAVVAILCDEPEADRYLALLAGGGETFTGAHVRLESTFILARNLGLNIDTAAQLFDDFLTEASVTVMAITDGISRKAVLAFARFGKGRGHPARLNFGDCLSYACAADRLSPILFKGADFTHTDLELAIGLGD
jgi:ribonuclease VapC